MLIRERCIAGSSDLERQGLRGHADVGGGVRAAAEPRCRARHCLPAAPGRRLPHGAGA